MLKWRKGHFFPRQHRFQNESSFTDRMTEGGRWYMNRLKNSIVRFLKYVIELENLIIIFLKYRLPILSQSILHSRQVPSIDFCYAGEGVEAVYNRKPLNREEMSEI